MSTIVPVVVIVEYVFIIIIIFIVKRSSSYVTNSSFQILVYSTQFVRSFGNRDYFIVGIEVEFIIRGSNIRYRVYVSKFIRPNSYSPLLKLNAEK